jgi:hypothetical protein
MLGDHPFSQSPVPGVHDPEGSGGDNEDEAGAAQDPGHDVQISLHILHVSYSWKTKK